MAKLEDIEGIGPVYAGKLREAGITTQEDMLAKAGTRAQRDVLASSADVSEKLLLNWVNRADLSRVNGIGEEFADLLEHSGVDSVPELAQRNDANLLATMTEVNATKFLVNRLPSETMVEKWVEEAKSLPRAVHH